VTASGTTPMMMAGTGTTMMVTSMDNTTPRRMGLIARLRARR
jgi:hypothetical protein